jgi:hypothetical protein
MAAPARHTPPDPEPPPYVATRSGDYTEVGLTLPADAVDEARGVRLAVLLRRLADALDHDGHPALRQWLDAAEAKHGAIPDAGVDEVLEDWAVRLEYLEQEERFAAMDELIADMEREHGPVNEERVQEIIRRWQAEYPHIDFPQVDRPASGSSSTATA